MEKTVDYDLYLKNFGDKEFQSQFKGFVFKGYKRNSKGMIISLILAWQPIEPPEDCVKFFCPFKQWNDYLDKEGFKEDWEYLFVTDNREHFVFVRKGVSILNPFSDLPYLLQEAYFRGDKWALDNLDWLLTGCKDSIFVIHSLL